MFVNPDQIIDSLEIEPGMTAADFGCGAGFYTLALARKIGERGRVYAFDIQKNMLEMVRSKARLHHLLNIEAAWADLEKAGSTRLKDGIIDVVFLSNILFQIEDKKSLLAEAKRILKPAGIAAVVEWEKSGVKVGPPAHHRISQEEVKKIFSENGFGLSKEIYAGDYHYGLMFRKHNE